MITKGTLGIIGLHTENQNSFKTLKYKIGENTLYLTDKLDLVGFGCGLIYFKYNTIVESIPDFKQKRRLIITPNSKLEIVIRRQEKIRKFNVVVNGGLQPVFENSQNSLRDTEIQHWNLALPCLSGIAHCSEVECILIGDENLESLDDLYEAKHNTFYGECTVTIQRVDEFKSTYIENIDRNIATVDQDSLLTKANSIQQYHQNINRESSTKKKLHSSPFDDDENNETSFTRASTVKPRHGRRHEYSVLTETSVIHGNGINRKISVSRSSKVIHHRSPLSATNEPGEQYDDNQEYSVLSKRSRGRHHAISSKKKVHTPNYIRDDYSITSQRKIGVYYAHGHIYLYVVLSLGLLCLMVLCYCLKRENPSRGNHMRI